MLSKAPPVPQLSSSLTIDEQPITPLSEDLQTSPISSDAVVPVQEPPVPEPDRVVEDVREVHVNAAAGCVRISFSAGVRLTRKVPTTVTHDQSQRHDVRVQKPLLDYCLFSWAAIGLTIAIIILLPKKFLKSHELAEYMDAS